MIGPALILAGGRLATLALMALQLALIARLPAGTPGIVLLHWGIATTLGGLMDLGTGQALLRLCATRGEGNCPDPARAPLIRRAFHLRLRCALVLVPLHLALVLVLADHSTHLLPAAVILLPVQALGVARTPFILQGRILPLVGTGLAGTGLSLGGTVLCRAAGITAPGPYLFLLVLGLSLATFWQWRLSGISLQGPVAPTGALLPQSRLLWLGTLVRSLYYQGDSLLVRLLAGPVALDLYTLCYRLFSAATLLPDALGELLLAPLTRARGARAAAPSWQLLTLLGLVPLVTGFFLAPPLLAWACGDRYLAGTTTMRLLLVAALLVYPASLQITRALAAGRFRAMLLLSLAGLATTLILCLLLVPPLGAAGAAWSTLVTEALILAGAAGINRNNRTGEKGGQQ